MYLKNVGDQHPTSKIFLTIMFVAKWLHVIPSRSSMRIISASYVVTHLHNLLSWPNLYIILFFNANGVVVANLYFSL